MPKAIRKTQPAKAPTPSGVVLIQIDPAIDAMGLWHKRLNIISGTMALTYREKMIRDEVLRTWVRELRLIADGMEKHLSK